MKKKIITYLSISTFFFIVILHFLRLMFNWSIIIGKWLVPTWISGLLIIFGVVMISIITKLKEEFKKEKFSEEQEEKEEDEEIKNSKEINNL